MPRTPCISGHRAVLAALVPALLGCEPYVAVFAAVLGALPQLTPATTIDPRQRPRQHHRSLIPDQRDLTLRTGQQRTQAERPGDGAEHAEPVGTVPAWRCSAVTRLPRPG